MFKFTKKFLSLIMAILMLTMTAIGVNAEELIVGTTDLLVDIGIIDPSPEEELMPMAATSCVNIVGTEYSEVKPTQDWINRFTVQNYVEKLHRGEHIDAIEILDIEGKGKYIIEGHHRYVASMMTGIPVPSTIRTSQAGPIGYQDWTRVEWVDRDP